VKFPHDARVSLVGKGKELLYRDGEVVGSLTTGAYSHTLNCPIGLASVAGPAKVPLPWLRSGTYEVEVADPLLGHVQRFPVEVSNRCLVDPKGLRVLGDHPEPE